MNKQNTRGLLYICSIHSYVVDALSRWECTLCHLSAVTWGVSYLTPKLILKENKSATR